MAHSFVVTYRTCLKCENKESKDEADEEMTVISVSLAGSWREVILLGVTTANSAFFPRIFQEFSSWPFSLSLKCN